MRMGTVSFLSLLTLLPLTLSAQRQASLGIGTGIVRYSGGSSFSALTVSPAAQCLTPSTYFGVSGAVSLLEGGVLASPGRAGVLGAWYTDVVGGVTVDGARTVGSVWLSGRLSKTYGSTGAASATVQYFVTPSVAVEASGGNYLRDPFQGLPRAGFVAGGVRVFASRRAAMVQTAPVQPALQPLVAAHRGGDTIVVRFRMPAAKSVAIAGNWNAWTPDTMRALGDDIWEAALRLPPGTYYFNLVVDGQEWVVPGGVATISDGMGGLLAILNVL